MSAFILGRSSTSIHACSEFLPEVGWPHVDKRRICRSVMGLDKVLMLIQSGNKYYSMASLVPMS